MNFSVEHVVAEYLDCLQTVEIYSSRIPAEGEDEKKQMVAQIKQKLETVRLALYPIKGGRKIFVAWRLLHRVGEDLILLMTFEELLAQGRKVLHDLKTSTMPDIVRLDWLPKVEESVKSLEGLCSKTEAERKTEEAKILCSAHLFAVVANIINDLVDDRFWDIWARKYMAFIYGVLLAAGLLLLIILFKLNGVYLSFFSIPLIGMIGGLASGILTSDQDFIAKGHFWISTLSYPLLRMVQGGLAALLMFAMIQSGYLISISPPIDAQPRLPFYFVNNTSSATGVVPFAKLSSAAKAKQTTLSPFSSSKGAKGAPSSKLASGAPVQKQKSSARTQTTGASVQTQRSSARRATGAEGKDGTKALLPLTAPTDRQFFLYFIMLLLSGFVGDKLLKMISDKVTTRLFAEAEKTKDAK